MLAGEISPWKYKNQAIQAKCGPTSRKLSSLGFVDVIGGATFLLPLLGLIAPGA